MRRVRRSYSSSTPHQEKGCEKKAGFSKEITEQEHKMYRSRVQRAMFLSQDRPDIMFAAKEPAKWASKPTMGHLHMMKRLAGYLKQKPRLVMRYRGVTEPQGSQLIGDSGTDWAGCCDQKVNSWDIAPIWTTLHQGGIQDNPRWHSPAVRLNT